MSDAEITEPFGVPEVFVDGFGEYELQGHNMSCLGFRKTKAGRIAVVRLTFPADAAMPAIEQAKAALKDESPPKIGIFTARMSKVN